MKSLFIPAVLAIITIASCAKLPVETTAAYRKIEVPAGPEDLVYDSSSTTPRLLISCGIKRSGDTSKGEIITYNIATRTTGTLQMELPDSIRFFPHGIDLVKVKDLWYLYAVNHEPIDKKHSRNSILRFVLKGDKLIFLEQFLSAAIKSPNAVSGMADGSFLVTNVNKGPTLSKGNIAYCKDGSCHIASGKMWYPNGITNHGNRVYVASTLEGKVYSFDLDSGKLLNKKPIARIKGGDNLRWDGSKLTLAAHLQFGKFLKHYKHAEKHSPSAIYNIDPATGTSELLYFNQGSQIDASSTGLVHGKTLFVTGVFEPKIIEVQLTNP